MAITGVFPGVGLTGGGITGDVFLSLLPATSTTIGGITPGAGCEVTPAGVLNILTSSVTGVTAGEGLGAPTTGDTITTTGTIKLVPPSSDGTKLGGIKAGPNIRIEIDGQITTENLLETNNPYAYNAYVWPAPASPIPAAPGAGLTQVTASRTMTSGATNNIFIAPNSGTVDFSAWVLLYVSVGIDRVAQAQYQAFWSNNDQPADAAIKVFEYNSAAGGSWSSGSDGSYGPGNLAFKFTAPVSGTYTFTARYTLFSGADLVAAP